MDTNENNLWTKDVMDEKLGKMTQEKQCYGCLTRSDTNRAVKHGHQSSSFIAKCNDNKFICGTSHYAAAEFETCKRLRVLYFYYQFLLFKDICQKSENDMMRVIYLAFFTYSRSAENIARGLESLLK